MFFWGKFFNLTVLTNLAHENYVPFMADEHAHHYGKKRFIG